jgi:hypothetical protein
VTGQANRRRPAIEIVVAQAAENLAKIVAAQIERWSSFLKENNA